MVPPDKLDKLTSKVFYLPMYAVYKELSSTTKICAVFDASAVSSSGISLNDQLRVGPTVHSLLVDVLIRFRLHRIAITTDVSRRYRMVLLERSDKDLHRFVWSSEPVRDYRMTSVTFGIDASSYTANMAVKQNAIDHSLEFPVAATAVDKSSYVDDRLTGADSLEEAIDLCQQLQELFTRGGFNLCKWSLQQSRKIISEELKEKQYACTLPDDSDYTKTLGVEWNTVMDHFRLRIIQSLMSQNVF